MQLYFLQSEFTCLDMNVMFVELWFHTLAFNISCIVLGDVITSLEPLPKRLWFSVLLLLCKGLTKEGTITAFWSGPQRYNHLRWHPAYKEINHCRL